MPTAPAFDWATHVSQGGTVTISWDAGHPGRTIDASRDAYVGEEPPSYQATAYDADGAEVAYGRALYYEDPRDVLTRMHPAVPEAPEPPESDPACPF